MSEALFSEIALYVLLTALIAYMGFIVWDLARKSNAGRFGTALLFMVLGAGVVGFVIKTILVETLDF
ncbi:DUF2788 domain-containing protein [Marinobacter halodurans]|uniref:DUF2788 domain-containing protein n=1 Tax=Marinobacter halodurans TaxID=2528979 RepID=A0ABY1ZNW9_9GAMM|nr:DUF2788 domain-containing protein [Marinobacter halodurans]TBW56638.1 DUF2788 domain-containing protein [Marinobacter halodurans]